MRAAELMGFKLTNAKAKTEGKQAIEINGHTFEQELDVIEYEENGEIKLMPGLRSYWIDGIQVSEDEFANRRLDCLIFGAIARHIANK